MINRRLLIIQHIFFAQLECPRIFFTLFQQPLQSLLLILRDLQLLGLFDCAPLVSRLFDLFFRLIRVFQILMVFHAFLVFNLFDLFLGLLLIFKVFQFFRNFLLVVYFHFQIDRCLFKVHVLF
jgi:hypothetical protein